MQNLDALFYVENGILASPHPDRLTVLFDRVGLQTNMEKMVSIVYQPCCTMDSKWEEAYIFQIMGEGMTYRAR